MPTADPRIVEGPAGARARLARNLVGALVGGLLIASVEFAATRTTVEYSIVGQLAWLARLALHWSLAALPLGIAFDGLERRAAPGTPSTLGYAIATLAGACVGAGVMAVHGKYVDPAISATALGFDLPLPDRFLYGFWQLGFWGAVGAVLHSTDLRRRLGAEALRAGEIARLRGETQLVDARLAALHAQVEPQFLLATLGRIERLYETDAEAADRVLDALIRFLREAIPALRRQRSTLAEERRLLQEYLGVVGAGEATAVGFDPAADALPVPPGLLVSLAQALVDLGPPQGAGLDLRLERHDGRVAVELSAAAGPGADVDGNAALREVADQAGRRLALAPEPVGSVTVLHSRAGRHTLRIALIDLRGADHG